MEWFAVTSAVTTSLAWAGADARARGAWVSLADVCRQTMTEGRIREARGQLNRVCRLARVGTGDLRAATNAGLIAFDGDDLVLTGWDLSKEREAAKAAQRARDSRQRQQRHEYQELPDETAADAGATPVLPGRVREPFANATPHADPNFGTEKRRGEKTKEETPPPSPQGVIAGNSRSQDGRIAATAATAQGDLPGGVRERFANADPLAGGTVREPFANAPGAVSQESPRKPLERPQQLTPKRSRLSTLPAMRAAALSDDALGIISAMGGSLRGPGGTDYTTEWQRELAGMDAREVMALCLTAAEPVRLPSGLRRERETWKACPLEERRQIICQACADHDIPTEKRPPPLEQPP